MIPIFTFWNPTWLWRWQIVWAVKHGHIGDAFFDLDAAAFLLRELQYERTQQQSQSQSTAEVKPPLQEEAAPAAVRQAEHGESVGELGGLQPQQQQGRYAGVTVPQLNGTASGPCPGHHAPSVGQEGSDCSSRDVDHRNLKNVGKAGQQSSSEGSVAKSQHSSACDVQVTFLQPWLSESSPGQVRVLCLL